MVHRHKGLDLPRRIDRPEIAREHGADSAAMVLDEHDGKLVYELRAYYRGKGYRVLEVLPWEAGAGR